MSDNLISDEKLEEYYTAFKGFAEKDSDKLKAENIEKALRYLSLNPSPEDVEDIKSDIGEECDFHTFAYIAYKHSRCINVADELVESFAIFDKEDTGMLPVEKIKEILKHINNPFTDDQINDLLAKVTITNDSVNYSEFVKAML